MKKSVLLVEDDETLLLGLTDNFRARGYDVHTVTDGQAAIDQTTEVEPDVVVLDIMIPRVNGFEVCRQLRESGNGTPIIMLTAKGQEDDIIRGLEIGADDYITKPFSIGELMARVQALLRRCDSATEVMKFDDFVIDLAAHRLSRAGQAVPLTGKEFKLLAYFVQRPGRALTRNEILNQVWGQSVIVTARSVDRCVTTLRSKIEPDPRSPRYIATIRDIGYRFEASLEGRTGG